MAAITKAFAGKTMMQPLTSSVRSRLSRAAHSLKPVIFIGKAGLSPEVLLATGQALDEHGLIKVKFISFKTEKRELAAQLAQTLTAELVRIIGNTAIFFREKPEKKL